MESAVDGLELTRLSDSPRYNIQAVEKAAGLSARTLRSWERRYGSPSPQRDAHGRRLYSDRDVAVIRWLIHQVQQGVAISRAVAMLSETSGESRNGRPSPSFAKLQLRLLQAIDWMDEQEMTRIVSESMRMGPVEAVVLELIQPVLYRMGDLWENRRLSVASEHFGTHLLRSALADLLRRGPEPSRPQHIMVGCPPGELHDVGALVFALFLRHGGFQVTYLGASLEAEGLIADLQRIEPTALCLSATMPASADALGTLYGNLAGAFPGVLAYAGRAFTIIPEPPPAIPGIFLGTDVRAAVSMLAAAL